MYASKESRVRVLETGSLHAAVYELTGELYCTSTRVHNTVPHHQTQEETRCHFSTGGCSKLTLASPLGKLPCVFYCKSPLNCGKKNVLKCQFLFHPKLIVFHAETYEDNIKQRRLQKRHSLFCNKRSNAINTGA